MIKAEMVYFKRNTGEDCIPVIAGSGPQHVDKKLITHIVPLREVGQSEIVLQAIKDIVCGERWPNWDTPEVITQTRLRIADLCDSILR